MVLFRANLTRADLTSANLPRAVLVEADLFRANLTSAYLHRAFLIEANLTEATLFAANLSDAELMRADLSDANLTGAGNLFDTFGAAVYNAGTDFTNTGFDPVAAGWVFVPEPDIAALQLAVLLSLAGLRRVHESKRRV